MDILLAMGISTTTDSSGYFLRLPGLLPVFIVPAVCFYSVLAIWVIKTVRTALSSPRGSAVTAKGADLQIVQ